jgi:hypothetical protein
VGRVTGWAPQQVGEAGLWFTAGLGGALIAYAWIAERNRETRRRRLNDCGFVLLFGATLTMTVVSGGPRDAWDWFVAIVSPIMIAAAFWRLFHTHDAPDR